MSIGHEKNQVETKIKSLPMSYISKQNYLIVVVCSINTSLTNLNNLRLARDARFLYH